MAISSQKIASFSGRWSKGEESDRPGAVDSREDRVARTESVASFSCGGGKTIYHLDPKNGFGTHANT